MPPPRDQRAADDARQIERMEKARAKANQTGAAADAMSFALALDLLHHNKVDERRNVAMAPLVDEAAACFDRARKERPEEAHGLLASKGELYLQFGRNDEGYAALHQSMAARPNPLAFDLLGKSYKEANAVADLERMCKKTLPVMETERERYFVLDRCIEYSGASTIDGALRWASKKDVQFYKEKRVEVDRARAEFAERQRADEERQREQWRAESRERDRQRSEMAGCERQCESVHSLCSSNCGSTTGCMGRCQSDAWDCKKSCRR